MEKVFFEEKQKFPGLLSWFIVFIGLAMCFPLLRGLYIRSILHQEWNSESMSNLGIIALLSLLLLVNGVVVWLVSSLYLELKIDQEGISYRYFPNHRGFRRINKNAIADYVVRKLTWTERTRGKRRRRLRGSDESQIFLVNGNKALVINLSSGQKLILGTQNPEGLDWAMKKLMSNSSL